MIVVCPRCEEPIEAELGERVSCPWCRLNFRVVEQPEAVG